jgi:hypothetical protein
MIPFPGGKARLAKTICSLPPQSGGTYIEPFAGRGKHLLDGSGAAQVPTLVVQRHAHPAVL